MIGGGDRMTCVRVHSPRRALSRHGAPNPSRDVADGYTSLVACPKGALGLVVVWCALGRSHGTT